MSEKTPFSQSIDSSRAVVAKAASWPREEIGTRFRTIVVPDDLPQAVNFLERNPD